MMNLFYLSKELVVNDIERFANQMKEKYDVSDSRFFSRHDSLSLEGKTHEVTMMGYLIEKDSKQYEVGMPYKENERGEYAILTKEFYIKDNDMVIHEHLSSLQEVFDRLGIKKKN